MGVGVAGGDVGVDDDDVAQARKVRGQLKDRGENLWIDEGNRDVIVSKGRGFEVVGSEDVHRHRHRTHGGDREHRLDVLGAALRQDGHHVAGAYSQFRQGVRGGRSAGRDHIEPGGTGFEPAAESGDGGGAVALRAVLEDPGHEQRGVQHRSVHVSPPADRTGLDGVSVPSRRFLDVLYVTASDRRAVRRGGDARRSTCTSPRAGSMLTSSHGRPVFSALSRASHTSRAGDRTSLMSAGPGGNGRSASWHSGILAGGRFVPTWIPLRRTLPYTALTLRAEGAYVATPDASSAIPDTCSMRGGPSPPRSRAQKGSP